MLKDTLQITVHMSKTGITLCVAVTTGLTMKAQVCQRLESVL